MGTDFFSSMFQGIADTFKAGAAVDQAKMAKETAERQDRFNRDALDIGNQQFRATAVIDSNNDQRNMILVAMGIVAVIVIIFILKK